MVEDPQLPFPSRSPPPRSTRPASAARDAAKYLFYNMGVGAVVHFLGDFSVFRGDQGLPVRVGELGRARSGSALAADDNACTAGGVDDLRGARRQPGLPRRRLHHRPRARVAEFRGRRARLGPVGPAADLLPRPAACRPSSAGRADEAGWAAPGQRCLALHRAADRRGRHARRRGYTLFRMRKNLVGGLGAAFAELKQGGSAPRTDRSAPSAT